MARRNNRGSMLLAGIMTAVLLAGCASVEEPKVIGEKQESQTAAESESSQDKTDISFREQVQAPERYQADVNEEGMKLTADAPVLVPEVKQVAVRKAAAANVTQEEYQKVKAALGEELGVEWKTVETLPALQSVSEDGASDVDDMGAVTVSDMGITDLGVKYQLTYRTFQEGHASIQSLIWLTRLENDGRSTSAPARHYRQGEAPDGQPAGRGKELEAKTTALLSAAGLLEYQLCQGRWRDMFYTRDGKEWAEAQYCTEFTPVIDGIGSTAAGVTLLGKSYGNAPYIEVHYRADGTLNQVKIIGRNVVSEMEETEAFLLPFEAVHQLFEQYCRDYFRSEEAGLSDGQTADGDITRLQEGTGREHAAPGTRAHVKVEKVKLEYACVDTDDYQKTGEQELIPVWSFYGSVEKEDGLILSIRAEDGQILPDTA